MIDNSGTVLNHIVYDSFGRVTSETDPTFNFRFGYTGRELDEETEMMYYRARYFDPAVGTFVGEDPLGFGAGDANLYRYVFNSPTNYTDPDGEFAFPLIPLAIAGGIAAVGTLAAYYALLPEEYRATPDDLEYLQDRIQDLGEYCVERLRSSPIVPPFYESTSEGDSSEGDGSEETANTGADDDPMERGRRSEERVLDDLGLSPNREKVSSPEGNAIPDSLDDDVSVEIKDTQRVSNTRQIRIQTDAARESGRTSILVTGNKTRVTRQAQESFDEIIRRPDLGPQ